MAGRQPASDGGEAEHNGESDGARPAGLAADPAGHARRVALVLAIATAGGLAADALSIPVPYMLGAIGASMAAAMAGLPVGQPGPLIVQPMRATLGVLLGLTITPGLLTHLGALGAGVALLPVYVTVTSALGALYYRRVGRFSREEAFFAALPGGLYTMTAFAEDSGVDVRRVSLAHAFRLALVAAVLPFLVQALAHVEVVRAPPVNGLFDLPPAQMGWFVLAGLSGWIVGRASRLPGGTIIGPMLASAGLQLSGLGLGPLPYELVIMAQIVLGSTVGIRFRGEGPAMLRTALIHALGHVALMLVITVLCAAFLASALGLPFLTGTLAFAPGGLAEMSLLALALGLDVGFVATLHLARILVILLVGPMVYAMVRDWLRR